MPLGFHHDQLKKFLEFLEQKPEILLFTESWLTDNNFLIGAILMNTFQLDQQLGCLLSVNREEVLLCKRKYYLQLY